MCDIYHAPIFTGNLEVKQEWIRLCTTGSNWSTILMGILVLSTIMWLGAMYMLIMQRTYNEQG